MKKVKQRISGSWRLILLLVIPFLLAAAAGILFFGSSIHDVMQIAVKAVIRP